MGSKNLIIVGIAFFIGSIIIYISAKQSVVDIYNLRKNGISAYGKVVNITYNNYYQPPDRQYHIMYTFKNKRKIVFVNKSQSNFDKYKIGDTVLVVYDKNDPYTVWVEGEMNHAFIVTIISFIFFIILGVIFIVYHRKLYSFYLKYLNKD